MASLSEFTILYVEDEKEQLEALAEFLGKDAKKIYLAENGQVGLEMFEKHQPDIVIADIQMPLMNGLQMSERIKEISPQTPIIITTAFHDDFIYLKSIDIGVDKFVLKPINNGVLLHSLLQCAEDLAQKREIEKLNETLQEQIGEIQKSEENLLVTIRSINDGIITTDENGKIVLMNKVAEFLTGHLSEDSIGKSVEEIFKLKTEKTEEDVEFEVEKTLGKDGKVRFFNNLILRSQNGIDRVISGSASPIHSQQSDSSGLVIVFYDITAKRKLQDELLRLEKSESINVLAGGIAHDFNNLLTAINGNISLAKMFAKPTDEKIMKRLEIAQNTTLKAVALTKQLMSFAKTGSSTKKTSSIVELVEESAHFDLRGSSINSEVSAAKDLWKVEIDQGQIGQVIDNLIINAKQAIPSNGTIWINCENEEINERNPLLLPNGNYVKISIRDDGTGISKESLNKIFDPYFTTKKNGNGLGLASCFSIIKSHNGHISVDSELGIGTTFTIYLPASETQIETPKLALKKLKLGKGNVLVMDDEETILEVAEGVLNHLGYNPLLAKNGEETIKIYQESMKSDSPIDLVIMDLTISGGLGAEETIQKLKVLDPNVRAIISSGYQNNPALVKPEEFGFCGSINKPFTVQELSETLHKALNLVM
ncbi:MAG: hybrid sensor histidine kinase/response regulator [Calditrichaeota bacterium]|nr:MAG: hybrid sensor histidine kinase/response regulator [Calditrichota bacterium]